jgi:hypothetical protein
MNQVNPDISARSSKSSVPESKGDIAKTAAPSRTSKGRFARDLYITPMARSVFITPPDGWIRWMSWDTIYAGDCRMEGAIIYLYPDGMIFFQASTFSSSSGDVWLIKGIQFLDDYTNPVGQPIPQHDGMTMAWEGSEYPLVFWDAIPGVTPYGAAQIRSATITSHC